MCLLRLQRAYRLHSLDSTSLSPPSSGASETNIPNLRITVCWGESVQTDVNLKYVPQQTLPVDVGLDRHCHHQSSPVPSPCSLLPRSLGMRLPSKLLHICAICLPTRVWHGTTSPLKTTLHWLSSTQENRQNSLLDSKVRVVPQQTRTSGRMA